MKLPGGNSTLTLQKQCHTDNSARNKSFFQDFDDANYYMSVFVLNEGNLKFNILSKHVNFSVFFSIPELQKQFQQHQNSKPSSTPCLIINSLSHFCWIMKTLTSQPWTLGLGNARNQLFHPSHPLANTP